MKQAWKNIEEIEPDEEEIKICNAYLKEETEFLDLDSLVQELGLDK